MEYNTFVIINVVTAMVCFLIGYLKGDQEGESRTTNFFHNVLRGYTQYVLPGETQPVKINQE
jgi:hypothetical protein